MKQEVQLEGIIKRHPDGFGFLIPDDSEHADVYIPKHSMLGIMTNDRVLIKVEKEKHGDRFRGEIQKIISRGFSKILGRFEPCNQSFGLILDESHGWGSDLKIKMEESLGAKKGELVSVEILSYPDKDKDFTGKVVEILGDIHDPLNDVKRVLLNNSIPHTWSKAVEKEASFFSKEVHENEFKGRVDLRDKSFITIDGATARDFDDAICVELADEGFLLWVAIADVSNYVRPGTAIDEEAYLRGTSVYFPNFVVPMLPEILSNELCSLNPHIPRLSMVAEMLITFSGEIDKTKFYEAVIESKARVTYGEAQEVIDGNNLESLKHVKDMILRAKDLAKILMTKRYRNGSLDLEIPETEMVLDGAGNPVDIIKSERLFSHRLIEEMMLIANVAVAQFIESAQVPNLYRIHDEPNGDAIEMLNKYLFNFGSRQKIHGGKLQKKLTKALEEFQDKPQAQILNILTLRSMAQAKYSSVNIGHFGLGFASYSHFTSPIRRYPDLIVHRVLKALVHKNKGYQLMSEEEVATAGNMLSACEQRSVKAERQFNSIKKARFMANHLGKEFEGVISSVARFGIFVILRTFDVDGLVRTENLGKGEFEFDEEHLKLVSRRSGFSFNIGDTVKIKVAKADPELGQIDFLLAKGNDEQKGEQSLNQKNEWTPNLNVEEKKHEGFKKGQANRKNFKVRKSAKKNSRGFRKARFSQRSRKD